MPGNTAAIRFPKRKKPPRGKGGFDRPVAGTYGDSPRVVELPRAIRIYRG